MRLKMWSYDLAREQSPSIDFLRRLCRVSLEAGYNALGLYLEHRFAYPSAPWAAGKNALTPDTVKILLQEFPELQIIPFVNLLGHMEGFIYTEQGQKFAEERFKGMQACPCNPLLQEFASNILTDILNIFPSEIIHIGADEIGQLGQCPECSGRLEELEHHGELSDPKAALFGSYFKPLAQIVLEAARTPAVWGDMFANHPLALGHLPKETIIFEWQYFSGPLESSKQFFDIGHPVVFCPTLNTYSAPWLHLPQAELNVREHASAAEEVGALGVCVTTWECELFGNYASLIPAIEGCGKLLTAANEISSHTFTEEEYREERNSEFLLGAYEKEGWQYKEWAKLMGSDLQDCGGLFAYGGIRSAIKARLLLYSNPFLLWLRNRDELLGFGAKSALTILDHAISVAPTPTARGISEFVRIAIEFVRHVEDSAIAYRDEKPGVAAAALAPARAGFDDLAKIAKANNLECGGSLADLERCRTAKEHVERVMRRIRDYGDGSLGYLPSYETICHPKFMPYDQGNWWLINDWANE